MWKRMRDTWRSNETYNLGYWYKKLGNIRSFRPNSLFDFILYNILYGIYSEMILFHLYIYDWPNYVKTS